MPFGNRKKYSRAGDLFSSVLSQGKKYHPSGNLKFNYFGIFQSLKILILMEKILLISLKLNFAPNTSGCYGLTLRNFEVYFVLGDAIDPTCLKIGRLERTQPT